MGSSGYIGRFAPSPTGRLHMGSLLAAVASWCDACHCGGTWLVRMEDLDPPREVKGAAQDILDTLVALGLHWDGPVVWQSKRASRYEDALCDLESQSRVYACCCTRRELAGQAVYPGNCREGLPHGKEGRLKRFRMEEGHVEWEDLVLGGMSMNPLALGDFPVLRADGFWAYQLAVVVDDMEQGITHVIRGADLLDSTPRQMQIWTALTAERGGVQRSVPVYGHVPIVQNEWGQKLSKQTLAQPVRIDSAAAQILQALKWLNQDTQDDRLLRCAQENQPAATLARAAELWDRSAIPQAPIQWQGGQLG